MRLAELRAEEAAIRAEFPEAGAKKAEPAPAAESAPAAPVRRRRRRRKPMSDEAKAAVSIRMKKYWADRRKAKGAKPKK